MNINDDAYYKEVNTAIVWICFLQNNIEKNISWPKGINVGENRRENQEWTIQRHRNHLKQDTKRIQKKKKKKKTNKQKTNKQKQKKTNKKKNKTNNEKNKNNQTKKTNKRKQNKTNKQIIKQNKAQRLYTDSVNKNSLAKVSYTIFERRDDPYAIAKIQ